MISKEEMNEFSAEMRQPLQSMFNAVSYIIRELNNDAEELIKLSENTDNYDYKKASHLNKQMDKLHDKLPTIFDLNT